MGGPSLCTHRSVPGLLPLLVCLLGLVRHTDTANVLLIPNISLSHVRYFAQTGEALVERGHNVHAITNGACTKAVNELTKANIKILPYYNKNKDCFIEEEPSAEMKTKMMEMFMRPQSSLMVYTVLYMQSSMFAQEIDELFADPTLFDRISALDFDLVVVDGMPLTMYNYIIPYKLNLPYVTLSTFFHASFAGVPDLPSFSPNMLMTSSDQMGFFERVQNTVINVCGSYMIRLLPGSRDSLVARHAPEKEAITINMLQRRSKLWLINTDVVIDYARTTLPNIINIGGLSTKPAKPLPDTIAAIADTATNGLVIVSFGSLIQGLPEAFIEKLLKAFVQFGDVTIVWKYIGPKIKYLPGNIKVLPWLPQNDILGHPNTRLFVTHCGNNGQFEALYHGVPMVGVPFFGDQHYNAKRMEVKGFGLRLALSDMTSDDLMNAMKTVLTNKTYSDNIKTASKIYRSRPLTARERAVFWIEHVLSYGGEHLESAGIHLPWYQYWVLDVAVFLLTCVTGVVTLSVYLLTYCCTLCRSKSSKQKIN